MCKGIYNKGIGYIKREINDLTNMKKASTVLLRTDVVILTLLAVLCVISKLIFGFDQDEQSIYAEMYRFTTGDIILVNAFGVKQIPALLMSPLFALSRIISVKHAILVFRIFSVFIKSLLAIIISKYYFSKINEKPILYVLLLSWFLNMPKYIIALDHSQLVYISLSLVLAEVYALMKNKGNCIRLAIWYCLFILCYPTMIVLVLPILVFLFGKGKIKYCVQFLATCAICAVGYVLPALLSRGFRGMLSSLKMMFLSSNSVGTSLWQKILVDKKEFISVLILFSIYLICLVLERTIKQLLITSIIGWIKIIILIIPFIKTLFELTSLSGPFKGMNRYLFVLMVLITEAILNKRKEYAILAVFIFLVFAIVFKSTSNGIAASCGYITMSTIILCIHIYEKNRYQAIVFITIVIVSQCVVAGCHYRTFGTIATSVFDFQLEKNENYLKGMYVEECTNRLMESTTEIGEALESENLIYFGKNMYECTLLGKRLVSPETNATKVINKKWEYYYKNNPVKDINVFAEEDDIELQKCISMLEGLGYGVVYEKQINEYMLYYLINKNDY